MNSIVSLKIIRYFIFSLFLSQIFISFSSAQILNIDRITTGNDSTSIKKLSAVIILGLDITQEDSRVINLNTIADLSYKFQKNVLILLSQYNLTSAENVKLINAGYSHLRFRFNRESNIQPELFTQYQWNGIRGMKSRFLAGANLRFLLNKDSLDISYFAIGLMNEWETWDYRSVPPDKIPINSTDKKTNNIKLNCYYNISQKILDNIDLSFIIYLQSQPNANFIYPRISPSIQLNVAVTEKFSISFIMNGFYDRKPVVPIRNFFYDFSSAINIQI